MKQYTSSRVKEAFKITGIFHHPLGGTILDGAGEDGTIVNDAYMDKHQPAVGGYYICYPDDGYQSYCPADVFESTHTPVLEEAPGILSNMRAEASVIAERIPVGDIYLTTETPLFTDDGAAATPPAPGGPRVTKEGIEARIVGVEYQRLSGTLTHCTITLENGFTTTGESSCVSPLNYDEAIGQQIAYDNAFDKIWVLEGYLLKERLWQEENTPVADIPSAYEQLVSEACNTVREVMTDPAAPHTVRLSAAAWLMEHTGPAPEEEDLEVES